MSTMAEISASRAYNEGQPGFYVVEPEDHIAVAGPFRDEAVAARIARDRNLAVYEVLA